MTTEVAIGGSVSAALEAELRTTVRRQGIVCWLDPHGHYTGFVDRLIAARESGELPYDVRAFRGSHLELMASLEGLASAADKVPLLIHLPGFTEESVRQTPLYELYAAGVRYRKALDTLITEAAAGLVRPDRIVAFIGQPALTLDAADVWLAARADDDGGGAAELRSMRPAAFFDDLLAGGSVAAHLGASGTEEAIWERLAVLIGLPASWRDATLPQRSPAAADVAFAAASWALVVEYVDDVKRPPVSATLAEARGLPRPVIDACRAIARHLRDRHAGFYLHTADETEALIADEIASVTAADLGSVETFRFEEDKLLTAAVGAVAEGHWEAAATSAARRVGAARDDLSFWLRDDLRRQAAWQLVHDAARLGQTIAGAGPRLAPAGSLDAAVETYVDRGAAVDQAHRHLEQRRAALLHPQLPDFERLRADLDGMRRAWRAWADAWARDFNAICRSHGFLPDASLQQRTLFDTVVRPLTQEAGTTALFLIDAFRFEMGDELYRQFAGIPATSAHLRARLAELPTVTAVGMNALAPVAVNERLTPARSPGNGSIVGFSTGEFRVTDPESRRRAMHDRAGGGTSPWLTLEEVVSRDTTNLKRAIAQASLLVVHSQDIDDAGEKGMGTTVFDRVLQKLRAAWQLLRDAGVRRFVFTSDHGFLLMDESAQAQSHGRVIDPKRRHVLSPLPADHTGEVRVSLADLGYTGADGYLMFPETTAAFDTGRRRMTFVHGGNSLQERVIPVLTVTHRAAAGGSTLQYEIAADAKEDVAGMHCLDVRVDVVDQRGLDFGSPREVELALRVVDAADVQVELCQTRGAARLAGAAVQASVGQRFELFFRLSGTTDDRVLIELHHPGGTAVRAFTPAVRFAVAAAPSPAIQTPDPLRDRPVVAPWLEGLEGGARKVFEHLAVHGAITESEAAAMLGGARGLRRFALQFEDLARRAPFVVRIDVIAGVKRYVREGRSE